MASQDDRAAASISVWRGVSVNTPAYGVFFRLFAGADSRASCPARFEQVQKHGKKKKTVRRYLPHKTVARKNILWSWEAATNHDDKYHRRIHAPNGARGVWSAVDKQHGSKFCVFGSVELIASSAPLPYRREGLGSTPRTRMGTTTPRQKFLEPRTCRLSSLK